MISEKVNNELMQVCDLVNKHKSLLIIYVYSLVGG